MYGYALDITTINLSDRIAMCLGIVKRRSYRYSSALHPGTRVVLPHTVGISNGLSHTLEVYRKVLHVIDCISEGPLCMIMH